MTFLSFFFSRAHAGDCFTRRVPIASPLKGPEYGIVSVFFLGIAEECLLGGFVDLFFFLAENFFPFFSLLGKRVKNFDLLFIVQENCLRLRTSRFARRSVERGFPFLSSQDFTSNGDLLLRVFLCIITAVIVPAGRVSVPLFVSDLYLSPTSFPFGGRRDSLPSFISVKRISEPLASPVSLARNLLFSRVLQTIGATGFSFVP